MRPPWWLRQKPQQEAHSQWRLLAEADGFRMRKARTCFLTLRRIAISASVTFRSVPQMIKLPWTRAASGKPNQMSGFHPLRTMELDSIITG